MQTIYKIYQWYFETASNYSGFLSVWMLFCHDCIIEALDFSAIVLLKLHTKVWFATCKILVGNIVSYVMNKKNGVINNLKLLTPNEAIFSSWEVKIVFSWVQ